MRWVWVAILCAALALPVAAEQISVTPPAGGSPTGAAGGSLTGTFPSPGLNLGGTNTGVLPVANGGVDQTAWSTYTPTVTCGVGSITTDTVAGRYKIVTTKTIIVQITLNIATLGTCTGSVTFTFPPTGTVNATGADYVGSGFNIITGVSVPAFAQTGSGIILFFTAAPVANTYYLTIAYETT
jgi:hypothetical protein